MKGNGNRCKGPVTRNRMENRARIKGSNGARPAPGGRTDRFSK